MRTIEQLEEESLRYWPAKINSKALNDSTLFLLLETQDDFLNLLKVANSDSMGWMHVLKVNKKLTANIFLKHLMVLSDVGGERISRFGKDLKKIFPNGEMKYIFDGKLDSYKFKSEGEVSWNNKKIRVEKSFISEGGKEFTDEMLDVCMLLLYGSSIIDDDNFNNVPDEIIEKCVIGSKIGKCLELDDYVKQRYLYVSRQTAGSSANDLGYAAEEYVKETLSKRLGEGYCLDGHTLDGVSQNGESLTKFDLVVKNNKTKKSVGIEISFQVTTNSVIERKSQNAKNRQDLAHKFNHKVAYVIDGAGNFQRRKAIQNILNYSDCTVNFSDNGLNQLSNFIKENTK